MMTHLDEYLNGFIPSHIPDEFLKGFCVTTAEGEREFHTRDSFMAFMEDHHEEIISTSLIFDMRQAKILIRNTVENILGDVK